MAVINGQFDMAMFLIEHGANPNLAAAGNGVTPLWAAVNTQWQPRTRFPQPQQMEKQQATYLDVMTALLAAGADPNARLMSHPCDSRLQRLRNRNCGLADTSGSTAFWRGGMRRTSTRCACSWRTVPIRTSCRHHRAAAGDSPRAAARSAPGRRCRRSRQRCAPARAAPAAISPVPLRPIRRGSLVAAGAWRSGRDGYIHAAAGVEYGEGFAGVTRTGMRRTLAARRRNCRRMGAIVNARQRRGYRRCITPRLAATIS
jgi:hypothetical protein